MTILFLDENLLIGHAVLLNSKEINPRRKLVQVKLESAVPGGNRMNGLSAYNLSQGRDDFNAERFKGNLF